KQIEIAERFDPQPTHIFGDSGRLQQVVWNLLSNAIKFTPKGGKVTVEIARSEGHAELSVTDNGVGIEPSFLPHVFDRFRQGDTSLTRKHGGLGLGLAIARHLVELHGGTVRASSGGKDQGANFTVILPVMTTHIDTGDLLRRSREVALPPGPSSLLEGVAVL